MRMMRCTAVLTISGTITNKFPDVLLQAGMEVDMDRELSPGHTVADATDGWSASHFEPVEVAPALLAPGEVVLSRAQQQALVQQHRQLDSDQEG